MSFSEWKEVKLSDVIESVSSKHRFDKRNIVLINTSDVLDGKVLNHTYVENKNLKGQFKKSFNRDDILYSEIRPGNKRYAYVDFNADDYVASTKLMVLRRKTEDIDNKYLFHVLTNNYFLDRMQNLAESRSGTFPQITFTDLGFECINLPPLQEQKAIAHILSTLDEKIEVNNKINKTLEEMAQAIFKHWFVDFEFPNEDGEPYKSSGGEMVDSELGLIPKGWKTVGIGTICSIQNGFAFKAPEYVEDGIKVIRTLNIGEDGFFNNESIVFLPRTYESDQYSKYLLQEFDVGLVMVGASIGKIGMILRNTAGGLQNQNMWRFRANKESVSQFYVYYVVKQAQEISKNWSTGSAREFYRKDSFSKIKVVLPNSPIMMRFHDTVKDCFKLISNNTSETEELKLIRDTLLPKLMSGEIRVPIDNEQ
jgi:type I restriction enzyme S subunit